MATPEEWFKNLPVVTKYYFVAAVATTTLISLGLVNPIYLYLDFDLVFRKFQIWRLITCFMFFGKFSLPFLFQIYILVKYFQMLEDGYFVGSRGTADLIILMVFGWSVMLVIAYLLEGLVFLGPALVFMVLYIWSRKDPYRDVIFWGFRFQAWHFPFVLLLFGVLIGSSPVLDIVGIVVGHMYHFLVDIVPNEYNRRFLSTPQFLYNYFEGRPARTRSWQRGSGHRLS